MVGGKVPLLPLFYPEASIFNMHMNEYKHNPMYHSFENLQTSCFKRISIKG